MAEAVARRSSIRPDSILNDVIVIVAPNPAQPEGTNTDQQSIDTPSIDNYGVQSIVITDTPLLTNADALLLSEYLLRADPNYWFTGLSINMHRLTDPQRSAVATLDIGDFVGVIKSFQYGTPSVVQKNLFVEGIDHKITTTTHHIDLHFSPVGYSQPWDGVTPTLTWESVPAGISWSNLIWTIL
jgi:hypothetical protein